MAICHYARYARYAYSCIDSQGREAFTRRKIRRNAVLVNTGTHGLFRYELGRIMERRRARSLPRRHTECAYYFSSL